MAEVPVVCDVTSLHDLSCHLNPSILLLSLDSSPPCRHFKVLKDRVPVTRLDPGSSMERLERSLFSAIFPKL